MSNNLLKKKKHLHIKLGIPLKSFMTHMLSYTKKLNKKSDSALYVTPNMGVVGPLVGRNFLGQWKTGRPSSDRNRILFDYNKHYNKKYKTRCGTLFFIFNRIVCLVISDLWNTLWLKGYFWKNNWGSFFLGSILSVHKKQESESLLYIVFS